MRALLASLCTAALLARAQAADDVAAPPAAARQAAEQSFDILEFVVDGNTALDVETIERSVYPFLGPGHAMRDVESARAALEAQYQKRGLLTVSVDIPEQKVDGGVVHLRVVEGRVGRLRVTGSRYFDLGYIRDHAGSVAPGSLPTFPQVQRELAELNRSPDRRVAPLLHAGRVPGTVDVDLNVEDQLPVHGSVELNDHYNAFTHPLRLSGAIRYDNLWQAGHSLGLTWTVAPQHLPDSDVLSATYLVPLGGESSLAVYGVHSSSDVNVGAGGLDALGKGNILGLRYVIPLPGSKTLFHSFTVGADHKQFGESTRLAGADTGNTPITYVPLMMQYAGFHQGAGALDQFALTATFAMAQAFGNQDAQFENKRYGATANFLTLRADLSRTQSLPADWALLGRLNGQLSPQAVISNEQLALGGADTVRGYLEAEALGDYGLQGTLEVHTPHLWRPLKERIPELFVFGFVDEGNLKNHSSRADEKKNWSLASAGLGVKASARSGLHLEFDWAHVMRGLTYTQEGSSRVEFRVSQEF